ncbi:hypothetical protein BXT84_00920 [Sulfobacillus thermotolerans]|uniref:Uncharacterized protein n=1 Tax=Sulfobacillus thermotolerans TaxID=338644 RepID=A0ABN5GWA5_9FIRM|nr:hypothetical protein BXT84_00920 [Sulfobacillus thermotolerans]
MHHLTWSSSDAAVAQALLTLSPTKGVIVGPGWVDIATEGEIGRQKRRQRIEELMPGIFVAVHGDTSAVRAMIALLAAVDAARFAAAARAFRARNPAPAIGHWVPRRAKRMRTVAHGWGRSGPVGCARVRGLDEVVDRAWRESQHQS